MTTYKGIDVSAATSAHIDGPTYIYYDESEFSKFGVDFMVDLIVQRAESEQKQHPNHVVWISFFEDVDEESYKIILNQPIAGYQPVGIDYDKCEEGFYVQVKDKTGWKPTVWIEVYGFGRDTYPIMDWNQFIFDMQNHHDREVHQFQADAMKDDGWMWNLIEEAVLDHLMANGLIDYDDDGICRMTN